MKKASRIFIERVPYSCKNSKKKILKEMANRKIENRRSQSSPNLMSHDDAITAFTFENDILIIDSCIRSGTVPDNDSKILNRISSNRPDMRIHSFNKNFNNKQNKYNNNDNDDNRIRAESTECTALLDKSINNDCELRMEHYQSLNDIQEPDSDILDTSIYSELHFPTATFSNPSHNHYGNGNGNGRNDCVTNEISAINGRGMKRIRRKQRSKSKCSATTAALIAAHRRTPDVCHVPSPTAPSPPAPPPHYTAFYVDSNFNQCDRTALQQFVSRQSLASNIGATPINLTTATGRVGVAGVAGVTGVTGMAPPTLTTATTARPQQQQSNQISYLLSHLRNYHGEYRGGSDIGRRMNWGIRKLCSQPSLPFTIGLLALGGVACTLVGIVLGSTGLIGHSTQYLSAALLLIGIGVSLLVIAGAIWRLSLPDVNECRCYQRIDLCRTCSSPFCENRILTGSHIYPEFQHRPPPPSYMTSLYGCNAAGLNLILQSTGIGINTPPPLYQSRNSLRTINSMNTDNNDLDNITNIEMLSTNRNNLSINQDENVLILNAVTDNINDSHIRLNDFKKNINNFE